VHQPAGCATIPLLDEQQVRDHQRFSLDWWGGRLEGLEESLEVVAGWCLEEAGISKMGESRSWCLADGSWALGAAVAANPVDVVERAELQDTLRMLAVERATRGLAVHRLGDDDLAPLAIAGSNLRYGASALRAKLSKAPPTKAYINEGRIYTICLLGSSEASSLEVLGVEELGLRPLAASGVLGGGFQDPGSVADRVHFALSLDSTPYNVRLAARLARESASEEAAATVLVSGASLILDLDSEELETWQELAHLAQAPLPLVSRLLEHPTVEDRGSQLAEHLAGRDLAGLLVGAEYATRPILLHAMDRQLDGPSEVRELVRGLQGADGRLRLPRLALTIDGDVRAVDKQEAGERLLTGRFHRTSGTPSCLMVLPATELDPRLAPLGSTHQIRLGSGGDRADAVRAAALGRAAQLGLWTALSMRRLDECAASAEVLLQTQWVVPEGDGLWTVDLTAHADTLLRTWTARPPFSYRVEAPAELESLVERVGSSLAAAGGDAVASGEVDLLLDLVLEVGEVEHGEDQGSILVGKKPWSIQRFRLDLVARSGSAVERFSTESATRKVFGGHDSRAAVPGAAAALVDSWLPSLGDLCWRCLDAPRSVHLESSDSSPLQVLLVAARSFGSVTSRRVNRGEEQLIQVELHWPGGSAGLERLLSTLTSIQSWKALAEAKVSATERERP